MARMASATAAAVLQQHANGLQAKLAAAEQQLRCGVNIYFAVLPPAVWRRN